MKKRFIFASLLGGFIAFVWSFVSWMVIPWHMNNLHRFENPVQVSEAIKQNAPTDGVYVLHPMETCPQDSMGQMNEAMCDPQAPFVFACVKRVPLFTGQMSHLIYALIIEFIAGFFICWLLVNSKSHRGYWDRVTFVTIIALVAGILVYLPGWNWWGFPVSYTAIGMLDLVIAWFLAGLAISKLIRDTKPSK